MGSQDWLTTAEAAHLAGVARVMIQKWISTSQLVTRRSGRLWVVSCHSLEEQLAKFGPVDTAGHIRLSEAARHYKISQGRWIASLSKQT